MLSPKFPQQRDKGQPLSFCSGLQSTSKWQQEEKKNHRLGFALRHILGGTWLGIINRTQFALGHLGLGRKCVLPPCFGMEIPQLEQRWWMGAMAARTSLPNDFTQPCKDWCVTLSGSISIDVGQREGLLSWAWWGLLCKCGCVGLEII